MFINIAQIAKIVNAVVFNANEEFIERVVTDSRKIKNGDLFVCLNGEHVDGHQFVEQAVQNGASAVVVERELVNYPNIAVLKVQNTMRFLAELANWWRMQSNAKVIGITGSAGKTTVKEMLASVLEQAGKTVKSYKNWNNQLGLPLSILSFSGQEDYWILETGINQIAEMHILGKILRPDFAMLINVGIAHACNLGDSYEVARQKIILFDYLSKNGKAFVNADFPEIVNAVANTNYQKIWFGNNKSDYQVSEIGSGDFKIKTKNNEINFGSYLPSKFVAENIAAVTSIALELGLSAVQIDAGLKKFKSTEQRFNSKEIGECEIIDDTYNANPLSMRNSISRAKNIAGNRDLYLVLGEMLELGSYSAQEHANLGKFIAEEIKPEGVYFFGEYHEQIKSELLNTIFIKLDNQSPESIFENIKNKPSVVLFKGSRSCKMENWIPKLEKVL